MFERLGTLVGLLQTKGAASSRVELANLLKRKGYSQASVRTVQRDINFLKTQGFDIQFSKSGGYTCVGSKAKLNGLLSDREEALPSLVLMRGVLNVIGKLDPSSGADVFLTHAGDLLERQGIALADLDNYISNTGMPLAQRLVPIFRALVKGVIERRLTRILYKGNKDESARTRVIRPYHLFECEGRWHCIAHCREARAMRTFALWRTDKVDLLDEKFNRPAKYDDPRTWEKKARIFGVWSTEGEPMHVRLKMWGYAGKLVQESGYRPKAMKIDECPNEPEAVEVSFLAHAFADIIPWILKWGCCCKVLSPATLVDKVREDLRLISELYE
jgi:predicted DNA-binding transcriptional regulator YafY